MSLKDKNLIRMKVLLLALLLLRSIKGKNPIKLQRANIAIIASKQPI